MIANLIIKPLKPKRKCLFGLDDALAGGLVAGLGSIGGSLLGGIFGSSAQSSSNETNMQIAQMNNEFNERMLERQIAYNRENQQVQNQWSEDMYNKYNSPQAQVEQMKKAGLNPYTQGNSPIGANQTSAQAGAINPPTATPVQVQPVTAMSDAIKQASSMLLQLPLITADTEGKKLDNVGKSIENDYKAALFQSQLGKMVEDTKNLRLKNTFQELSNKMAMRTFDMEVDRKAMENRRIEIEIQAAAAQLVQHEVVAKYAEKEKLQELELRSAQIISEYAKGKLTNQQLKTEVHRTAQECAKAKYADDYENYIMQGAFETWQRLKNENSNYEMLGTYDASVTHEQINEAGGSLNGNVGAGGKGAGGNVGAEGHKYRRDKVTYKTKRSNVKYDGNSVTLYD